jgi:hypothetical protein
MDSPASIWPLLMASSPPLNASAMYEPPKNDSPMTAQFHESIFMPTRGSAKYRKNSCIISGVFRESSIYMPQIFESAASLKYRAIAQKKPIASDASEAQKHNFNTSQSAFA